MGPTRRSARVRHGRRHKSCIHPDARSLSECLSDAISEKFSAYAKSVRRLESNLSQGVPALTNILHGLLERYTGGVEETYEGHHCVPEPQTVAIDNLNDDLNLVLEEAQPTPSALGDDLANSIMRPVSEGNLATEKVNVEHLVNVVAGAETLQNESRPLEGNAAEVLDIFDKVQKRAIDRLMRVGPDALQYRYACPFAKQEGPNYKLCFFVHLGTMQGVLSHLEKFHHLDISDFSCCEGDSADSANAVTLWDKLYQRFCQPAEESLSEIPTPYFDPAYVLAEVGLPQPTWDEYEDYAEGMSLDGSQNLEDIDPFAEETIENLEPGDEDIELDFVDPPGDIFPSYKAPVQTSVANLTAKRDKPCPAVEQLGEIFSDVVIAEVRARGSDKTANDLEKLQNTDKPGYSLFSGVAGRLMALVQSQWQPSATQSEIELGADGQSTETELSTADDFEDTSAYNLDISDETSRAMIMFYIAVFVEYESERLPFDELEEGPVRKGVQWYRSLIMQDHEPIQRGNNKDGGRGQVPSTEPTRQSSTSSRGKRFGSFRVPDQQGKKTKNISNEEDGEDGDDDEKNGDLSPRKKPKMEEEGPIVFIMEHRCICAIMKCRKHQSCWKPSEPYVRQNLPGMREHIKEIHYHGKKELLGPFRHRNGVTTWSGIFIQSYRECGRYWPREVQKADPVVFVPESKIPAGKKTISQNDRYSVSRALEMVWRCEAVFRGDFKVPEYPFVDGHILVEKEWDYPAMSHPNHERFRGLGSGLEPAIELDPTSSPPLLGAQPPSNTQPFPTPDQWASPQHARSSSSNALQSPVFPELQYLLHEYWQWPASTANSFSSPSPGFPPPGSGFQSPGMMPSSPIQYFNQSPQQYGPMPTAIPMHQGMANFDQSSASSAPGGVFSSAFSSSAIGTDMSSYDMVSSSPPARYFFPPNTPYTVSIDMKTYEVDPDIPWYIMHFSNLDEIARDLDARLKDKFPRFDWGIHGLKAYESKNELKSLRAVVVEMDASPLRKERFGIYHRVQCS